MQNALRRQNLPEVELERAEIKDEAKWEVGQDIKDAWGIESKQSRCVCVCVHRIRHIRVPMVV